MHHFFTEMDTPVVNFSSVQLLFQIHVCEPFYVNLLLYRADLVANASIEIVLKFNEYTTN